LVVVQIHYPSTIYSLEMLFAYYLFSCVALFSALCSYYFYSHPTSEMGRYTCSCFRFWTL